jgi:hypothetical protein
MEHALANGFFDHLVKHTQKSVNGEHIRWGVNQMLSKIVRLKYLAVASFHGKGNSHLIRP